MSASDTRLEPYRDRWNHDATMGPKFYSCFCWATSNHPVGNEVSNRHEAASVHILSREEAS